MKKLLITLLLALFCAYSSRAQNAADVFSPIAKYMSKGDVESLSAWFGDSMEISILSKGTYCSKNQAKQILKSFFSTNSPSTIDFFHSTEKRNMLCAVGTLSTKEDTYSISIFLSLKGDSFQIRQISINRRL